MPRPSKSQWDFGDLFAAPARRSEPERTPPPVPEVPPETKSESKPAVVSEPAAVKTPSRSAAPAIPAAPVVSGPPPAWSVTELTQGIKRQLEDAFGAVRVTGEISNFRLQASGHAYFVLKDAQAQLSCVLFRGQSGGARNQLRDGVKVTLTGEITVYEPRGQYQLRVTAVELEGVGALQAAFERLKARLQAEGLFASERKRPIPAFPRRVGLVTSPTGAAIRDVLHVVERRFAGLEFVLVPVRVQGEGAAAQIAAAVRALNEWELENPGSLQAILVTRGGGSLEDLWAFNEEVVARALAESALPVISAVGHEVDFTISDFVADLRAATPSAAAELLTAGYVAAEGRLVEGQRRLRWMVARTLGGFQETTQDWVARLQRLHPRRQLEARAQRVDDLTVALARGGRRGVREAQVAWQTALRRLTDRRPAVVLEQGRRRWLEARRRLSVAARRQWERSQVRWERADRSLRLLSPLQVLERGYSLTFDASTGRLLRAASEAKPGELVRTRLAQGEVDSRIEAVRGAQLRGSPGVGTANERE
ncbi:MAG: exodeoxyribonuclease VII large subunit [Verrucomicrobia bacterium]|nr:exodeoxyribonuclease VII large subunit [Verrucomicrobiota bacterium]